MKKIVVGIVFVALCTGLLCAARYNFELINESFAGSNDTTNTVYVEIEPITPGADYWPGHLSRFKKIKRVGLRPGLNPKGKKIKNRALMTTVGMGREVIVRFYKSPGDEKASTTYIITPKKKAKKLSLIYGQKSGLSISKNKRYFSMEADTSSNTWLKEGQRRGDQQKRVNKDWQLQKNKRLRHTK